MSGLRSAVGLAAVAGALVAIAGPHAHAQAAATWQATTMSVWSNAVSCADAPPNASGGLTAAGAVSSALAVAGHRGASVSVSGGMAVGDDRCGLRWSSAAAVQTTIAIQGLRLWVAYSASRAVSPDTAVRQPGISAGLERRVGAALFSMSLGPRRDRTSAEREIRWRQRLIPDQVWPLEGTSVRQETTYVADTVARLGARRVADVGLGLRWTHRALGVEAAANLGVTGTWSRTDPLARLQLTYVLTPRVSGLVGLASRASVASLDLPGAAVATIGFRVHGDRSLPLPGTASSAGVATEFRAVVEARGLVSIAVRAPRAHRIEIAGDFSQWQPLELRRARDGWWTAHVRALPGPHRVSLRVDAGRWSAPPGLPPVRDEFGDTVGLLAVQE